MNKRLSITFAVFLLLAVFILIFRINNSVLNDSEPPSGIDSRTVYFAASLPLIDSFFLDYQLNNKNISALKTHPISMYLYNSGDTLIVDVWEDINPGITLSNQRERLFAVYELNGFICLLFIESLDGIISVSDDVLSSFLKENMATAYKQVFPSQDTTESFIEEIVPVTGHTTTIHYKVLNGKLIAKVIYYPFEPEEEYIYR